MTMYPITTEMLRDDWTDHPTLSNSQKVRLSLIADDQLQAALDTVFDTAYFQDMWFYILDNVRAQATEALLRSERVAS